MAVRIFVGVKIAPEIASELVRIAAGLARFPVRLVAPADIHLTLVPPWNEVCCSRAIAKLQGVVSKFSSFVLTLQHVGYGPHPRRPHLLWVDCIPTAEISTLRAALLQCFGREDERPFRPHITLARIRESGSALARKHPIDQDVCFAQSVRTIELFQSPEPQGSGYRTLVSAELAATTDAGSAK